ncbi:MAG: glycoside hydrolase family 31 protein [Terracidiphilus sp.]|nr:glycoside hydrolase family 31 protein [Terracidiphilus sp.]
MAVVLLLLYSGFVDFGRAQTGSGEGGAKAIPHGVRMVVTQGNIDVEAVSANIFRVNVHPGGKSSSRTLVLDPKLTPQSLSELAVHTEGPSTTVKTSRLFLSMSNVYPFSMRVCDESGKLLVEQLDPFAEARSHRAQFHHVFGENLYGMRALERQDNGGGLLRNNGAVVAAGAQGDAGAPWFFTARYGILIDSDGGEFFTEDGLVEFDSSSRNDLEYFVIAGKPMETFAGLATLTGRPPLPPKWTLGFLNSQWGADESEIRALVSTYREKHIPIDAFILDYDWKAWGEDNYGEWRWNSGSTPGSFAPNKFPNGASGIFAKEMRREGIKLCGILKPRILVYKHGSSTDLDAAATYADGHKLWYPGEPVLKEFPPVRDLDFANPETRTWFWSHLEPSFDAGMIAWWNDEADHTHSDAFGSIATFSNFQFFNMGRMLYDGQRGHSDMRVWSINRNYYLGAQRYGYAEWSGDIYTGFESMQDQRMRMLATLNLGEPNWGMDTGGFFGHPSPENYARWMEFSAFVPIFRVHGNNGEKRQPWVYGPVAEAAATKAIRLRYELMPYIYSYERAASEAGIGIVRPLFWEFPDDLNVANDGTSWMFGASLLVSPVVSAGAKTQRLYLPAGIWFDYWHGTRLQGGRSIDYSVDSDNWQDIPLFVRDGGILASQESQEYVNQRPVAEVVLDVFPNARRSDFVYYDDDGETYAYEKGSFMRQVISASSDLSGVHVELGEATGQYHPALRSYIVRVHGTQAKDVLVDGRPSAVGSSLSDGIASWSIGTDRFGGLTAIRVPAGKAIKVEIR